METSTKDSLATQLNQPVRRRTVEMFIVSYGYFGPAGGVRSRPIAMSMSVCLDRGYNTIKHCDKTAKTKSTAAVCFSVLALLQLLHVPATTLR